MSVRALVPFVVTLVPVIVPGALALGVDALAEDALVVHVPGDAPRAYALEADARARVTWVDAAGNATVLSFTPDAALPVTLAPGRHAFAVTHAARAGWLLVVPEDAEEPGAAFAFERRHALRLWLTDHAWPTLAVGTAVAAAVAGGRTLRQKA